MVQGLQKRFYYCPFCGEELPKYTVIRFCPFCGEELISSDQPKHEMPNKVTLRTRGRKRQRLNHYNIDVSHTVDSQNEVSSIKEQPVVVKAIAPAEEKPPSIEEQASDQKPLVQESQKVEIKKFNTIEEIMNFCDQLILQKQQAGWSKEKIALEVKDMMKRLKDALPEQPKRRPVQPKQEESTESENYYSIILKSCSDKNRLSAKLAQVLRRGPTAVKMAVDTIPSVILYKAKAKELEHVLDVLKEEYSAISIIHGDFAPCAVVGTIFPDFCQLEDKVKRTIRSMPSALWLGDRVLGVYSDVYFEEKDGVLVITNHHLYFLFTPQPGAEPDWFVIPFLRIGEVEVTEEYTGANLEITSKNEFIGKRFFMSDFHQAELVAEQIEQAMEAEI